jgi:hypothetical protein
MPEDLELVICRCCGQTWVKNAPGIMQSGGDWVCRDANDCVKWAMKTVSDVRA